MSISAFLSTNEYPDDWYHAGSGGALIGMAAVLYLIMYGRVCGISGIVGRVLDHSLSFGTNKNEQAQLIQFGFIVGLLLSSLLWLESCKSTTNPLLMLLAGLLVGFGTRLGSGCTSGHGICGLARKSMRSVVAVSCFLFVAIISSTFTNSYFADLYESGPIFVKTENDFGIFIHWITVLSMLAFLLHKNTHFNEKTLFETLSSIGIGLLFGKGLILSGMVHSSKIIHFLNMNPLNFSDDWDPSLLFVLGFGLLVSVTMYPIILSYVNAPICDSTGFHMPTNTVIDNKLMIGASIFGVGWGIGGICPGPAVIIMMATRNTYDPFWLWMFGLMVGMRIFRWWKSWNSKLNN